MQFVFVTGRKGLARGKYLMYNETVNQMKKDGNKRDFKESWRLVKDSKLVYFKSLFDVPKAV